MDVSTYSYLDFYRSYGLDIPQGVTIGENNWVAIKCPFHDDRKPSAGIFLETGLIHCLTCNKSWSCVDYLIEQAGLDVNEAVSIVEAVRLDYSLTTDFESNYEKKQPILSRHFETLYEQSQKYMSIDRQVVSEYIRARGIEYQTLLDLGIGCLPPEAVKWGHEVLVFPYIYQGRVVGLRYRDIGGSKGCEPRSYFTLGGLDRIEDADDVKLSSKVFVLTEGETDRLRTYQALKHANLLDDFEVFSLPSARFEQNWRRELVGARAIIFIPQDDAPSTKCADLIRKAIPSVEVVKLQFTRKEKSSKDICDWLRIRNDSELTELILAAIKAKPRKVQTFSEFKASVSETREWLVDNLISLNQIFTILGPPKSQKTFLALNLVRSLITGENFLGLPQLTVSSNVEDTKILFWEEEGSESEFLERINWIFADIPEHILEEQVFFASHLGLKLDTDEWMEVISSEIEQRGINLVIFDPFSRLFTCDENDASEMAAVWSRLANLQHRHKRTSFVIIHHTSKAAGSAIDTTSAPLEGARGSGRTASEVDGGIVVAKQLEKDRLSNITTTYMKCRFEGRFADITNPDGDPVFKLHLGQDGRIVPITALNLPKGRGSKLYRLLEENGGSLTLAEIEKLSNGHITKQRIRNYSRSYVDPSTGECLLEWDEETEVASILTTTGF